MRYTFQNGPNRIVHATTHVTINGPAKTWTTLSDSDPEDDYKVDGLDTLQDGRGKLVLHGADMENKKKVETLTNVTIGKELFIMERESRLPGQEFKFRHVYNFTRPLSASNPPPARRKDDDNLPAAPEPVK
jgi:hypothetical protein